MNVVRTIKENDLLTSIPMQHTHSFEGEMHSPHIASFPLILGGFVYDRADITDVVEACTHLWEKLGGCAERMKTEDRESERADLYLFAMSSLLYCTSRDAFEMVYENFFPATNSPEEAEQREQAIERFNDLVSDFNKGLGQCISDVRVREE